MPIVGSVQTQTAHAPSPPPWYDELMKKNRLFALLLLGLPAVAWAAPAPPFGAEAEEALQAALKSHKAAQQEKTATEVAALTSQISSSFSMIEALGATIMAERGSLKRKAQEAYFAGAGYERVTAFWSAASYLEDAYAIFTQSAREDVARTVTQEGTPLLTVKRAAWRLQEAEVELQSAWGAYLLAVKPAVENDDPSGIESGAQTIDKSLRAAMWLIDFDGVKRLRDRGLLRAMEIRVENGKSWLALEIVDPAAAPLAKAAISRLGQWINIPAPVYVGLARR